MVLDAFNDTSGNGNSESADEDAAEEDEEKSSKPAKLTGYVLEYDAARKITQGLGGASGTVDGHSYYRRACSTACWTLSACS